MSIQPPSVCPVCPAQMALLSPGTGRALHFGIMLELPIQLEPKDFDWHRVYGHEEFLDEVLDKHAWKVMELLFALEYADMVEDGEMDLEGIWDLVVEEQAASEEDPEQPHPTLLFGDGMPETYFMASRLLQEASNLINGRGYENSDLSEDLWHLCAQLAMLQLPIVGLSALVWEESSDLTEDLLDYVEAQDDEGPVRDIYVDNTLSPGALRWRPLQASNPPLADALIRLEDLRAAYEAFLSVSTFDPRVDELALGLVRACTRAHTSLLYYCLPSPGGGDL